MRLPDWIKSPLKAIREKFFPKIDVGGFSIIETIKRSRQNTKRMHDDLIDRRIRNDWTTEEYDGQLAALKKRRQVQLLTTYKNIGSSVRGYARSLLAVGREGRFYNVGVLDERQTTVCAGYMGQSWPKPYSAIPERPPRTQRVIHRCRSYLEFRTSEPDDTRDFITQFNDSDDELKRQLLGPVRFEEYKAGRLPINSYSQYERAKLFTLEELGIE